MMTNIDKSIARVRAFAMFRGWRPARYAKEAGLSVNALSSIGKDDWNPSAETLRKLEAVIPSDWAAPVDQQPPEARA